MPVHLPKNESPHKEVEVGQLRPERPRGDRAGGVRVADSHQSITREVVLGVCVTD